jgi:hypothetical protein
VISLIKRTNGSKKTKAKKKRKRLDTVGLSLEDNSDEDYQEIRKFWVLGKQLRIYVEMEGGYYGEMEGVI